MEAVAAYASGGGVFYPLVKLDHKRAHSMMQVLVPWVHSVVPKSLWKGHIAPKPELMASPRVDPLSVQAINDQFMSGGLFVHQFDASQDDHRPWLVNTTKMGFTSISIASQAFPYIYSTSLGGMLYSPSFFLREQHNPVRCACACDCNSMNRGPTGCSNVTEQPGSLPAITGCHAEKDVLATAYRTVDDMLVRLDPVPNSRCIWTPTVPYDDNPVNRDAKGRVRPPPGETLLGHFSCMYNEIVIDASMVNAAMPSILDAFFITTNCWRDPRAHLLRLPTNISQLEAVYGQFVEAYPSVKAPLLLKLDCAKLAKNEPPFADASHLLMPVAAA